MADIKYHQKIKELYGVPDIQVREDDRKKITAICRMTAWNLEKEGKFPKRKTLSGNHVSWSMAELMEWVDNRGGAS